jgi:hypothetical protein
MAEKWFFLLALFALASAMTLDLSAPIYYKNIANGLAAALFGCNAGTNAGQPETGRNYLCGHLAVMAVA